MNKTISFQVEYIRDKSKASIIMARILNEKVNFELTDSSKLGGVEIKKELSMPRKVDENGNPVLNTFIFHPKKRVDLNKIKVGQTIELEKVIIIKK